MGQRIAFKRRRACTRHRIVLTEGRGRDVQRRGDRRQAVQRRGGLEGKRQFCTLRRHGQRCQRGNAGQGDRVGLHLCIAVRSLVLRLQREGAALHALLHQIGQAGGRAVPRSGGAGHILAVCTDIDGTQVGGVGVRNIPHRRIQIDAAQRLCRILDPVLGGVCRLILRIAERHFAVVQQADIAEPLAIGQRHGDLRVSGYRQRSIRAVIAAVGHTEFVVARNDLYAVCARGNIAVGIRQRDHRCGHRRTVLRGCGGNGVFRAVQQLSVVCNGVVESVQQRGGRLRGGGTQALQCRRIGIGRRGVVLDMVRHIQIVRHTGDEPDGIGRVGAADMEAKRSDGRSLGIQFISALIVIKLIVGGYTVDLIDEALLQTHERNVRIGQCFLYGLSRLVGNAGRLHDGAVGVHGREHKGTGLPLCGEGCHRHGQQQQYAQQKRCDPFSHTFSSYQYRQFQSLYCIFCHSVQLALQAVRTRAA